jgi:AraC family transcriptional regulator
MLSPTYYDSAVPQRGIDPEHVKRINRVVDRVAANLAAVWSLEHLARVAAFSPFHFHRVFRAVTGETTRRWVARLRVERAVLMLGRAASKRRLAHIARELGYASLTEFSRAFYRRFGVLPSDFRRANSKNSRIAGARASHTGDHDAPVRLVVRGEQGFAYVRVGDCLAPGRLAWGVEQLFAWAAAAGVTVGEVWGASNDDPAITPFHLLCYDVGCEVPPGTAASGEVGVRTFDAGPRAELAVRGGLEAIERGWGVLFSWLASSRRYELGEGPCIERFRGAPDFDAWGPFDVVLSLSIRSD